MKRTQKTSRQRFSAQYINKGEANYPSDLRKYLGEDAPRRVTALGNIGILSCRGARPCAPTLALFCSVKCPGSLILKTYDLAQTLRQASIPVIGGFHSPIERECLRIFLRGTQPVVICPARNIEGMRMPKEFIKPLEEGRLLMLSPFDEKERRATVQTALYRNRFVAALADRIFVSYAEPNSKTENFCSDVLVWQKTLYTLESKDNKNLMEIGAKIINFSNILEEISKSRI